MSHFHLGINLGHDRSAAVVKDGKILVAIEQERLDRNKHSVGFMLQSPSDMSKIQIPWESVSYCLDAIGISWEEISTVTANMAGIDHSSEILKNVLPSSHKHKVKTIPSHHLAHAYTAFWPSGFDEALVLVADASGSTIVNDEGRFTESYTIYEGRGNELKPIHSEKIKAHLASISTLGFVYELVSRKAGFVTDLKTGLSFPEAGKLMGLAAYGGPQENWFQWLSKDPITMQLRMSAYDIFLEIASLEKRYDDDEGKPYFRPWLVDLAYKVQAELETVLCELVEFAKQETGLDKLCMAGGVALNSVANYKILKACDLEDIFIFPAAADNGISAGCALWAYHQNTKIPQRQKLETPFLGKTYSEVEINEALDKFSEETVVNELDGKEMEARVAELLAKGNIIARYEGGAEYGPRALGHRSILADPTYKRMKDVVNARVKFREAFRPFAPVIPKDRIDEVFDLDKESPYMLLVAPLLEEYRDALPAITHKDGTGRIQTCTKHENPFFHNVCNLLFDIRGGAPVLLNTSFNVAGQPIVETPEEAIETFLMTDIDYLALEGKLIQKRWVKPKAYEGHIKDLQLEAMPKGLDPGQPSVEEMMSDLDQAITRGAESKYWSQAEVVDLSKKCARYKETSTRFPNSPFIIPLSTQLGPFATLILDLQNENLLIDEYGSQPTACLSDIEAQLFLALSHYPDKLEEMRLAFKASPLEFEQMLVRMIRLAESFQISVHQDILPLIDPELYSEDNMAFKAPSVKMLEIFENADLNLKGHLKPIRKVFHKCGYDEDTICNLLSVESLQQIEPTKLAYYDSYLLQDDPLSDLIRLFLIRSEVPKNRVKKLFSANDISLLENLGLIDGFEDSFIGCVDIFCSDGFLFVTDHRYMIKDDDMLDEDPVMYIGMDSHGLVQTAPRQNCDNLLDLCSGSGIQGIIASRYAKRIISVDINPRAIRFSRFNAQLNGVSNHEVREGNLYDVVDGEKFDVILANPPFVPSPEDGLKFRDGGVNGENILRNILQNAQDHLTSNGRICIVTDLVDIDNYHSKIKSWMPQAQGVGAILSTADRDEILFSVPHCHAPFNQSFKDYNQKLGQWVENFRASDLKSVNFGYILIWLGNDVGLDLTTRIIHNPAKPIWHDVEDWIAQRGVFMNGGAKNMLIKPHDKMHISTKSKVDGTILEEVASFEGGSPFFTDYTLTPVMVSEIKKMVLNDIKASEYINSKDHEWVNTLLRIGVLRLVKKSEPKRTNQTDHDNKSVIRQKETKTTPTCLSSYLG